MQKRKKKQFFRFRCVKPDKTENKKINKHKNNHNIQMSVKGW